KRRGRTRDTDRIARRRERHPEAVKISTRIDGYLNVLRGRIRGLAPDRSIDRSAAASTTRCTSEDNHRNEPPHQSQHTLLHRNGTQVPADFTLRCSRRVIEHEARPAVLRVVVEVRRTRRRTDGKPADVKREHLA